MVRIQICSDRTCQNWDTFVETNGGSHLQASMWARVKEPLGWESIRLIVFDDNCIVAGMQILMRRVPLIGRIAYVPYGPLVKQSDTPILDALQTSMEHVVRRYRIQYLHIQPAGEVPEYTQRLLATNFRPSLVSVAAPATIVLDLTQELDTIWAKIKKNRRKQIRRSSCNDLVVREGGWEDLDSFCDLMSQLVKRRNGRSFPSAYYKHKWSVLHAHGSSRLFILEYNDEPVTMHWVVPFGNTLVSKLAVWSGKYAELHPNDFLEWSMIQWAKAQGYHYYDFEGMEVQAAHAILNDEELPPPFLNSATSFKLSFGGTPIVYAVALDRISNPVLRWVYAAGVKPLLNQAFLKKIVARMRTQNGNLLASLPLQKVTTKQIAAFFRKQVNTNYTTMGSLAHPVTEALVIGALLASG